MGISLKEPVEVILRQGPSKGGQRGVSCELCVPGLCQPQGFPNFLSWILENTVRWFIILIAEVMTLMTLLPYTLSSGTPVTSHHSFLFSMLPISSSSGLSPHWMDEMTLLLPGASVQSTGLHEVILSSTVGGSGTELVLMQPQAPRPVPC